MGTIITLVQSRPSIPWSHGWLSQNCFAYGRMDMVPLLSPHSNDPYRYKNGLLKLPMRNGVSPLEIGLDETNVLCACFASDVPSGTIIEQLDGDFLPCCPIDTDSYHPFHYPDMNLNVTLLI